MRSSKNELRHVLRIALASVAAANLSGLCDFGSLTRVHAQERVPLYSDAIVLPKYYPGIGPVLALGGIEPARPATTVQPAAAPIGLVSTQVQPAGTYTVHAEVTQTNPTQVQVTVTPAQQGAVVPQPVIVPPTQSGEIPLQPNQISQLNRNESAPGVIIEQPPRDGGRPRDFIPPRQEGQPDRPREQRPEGRGPKVVVPKPRSRRPWS